MRVIDTSYFWPKMIHIKADDYGNVPREKRVLARGIHVQLTLNPKTDKIDERGVEYLKTHPLPAPPAPTRSRAGGGGAASIFAGLTRRGSGGGDADRGGSSSTFYLPPEITSQILSHFLALDAQRSHKDPEYRTYCSLCHLSNLYNIALTSRTWNGPATEALYSTLKLTLDDLCAYHHLGIPWRDGLFWFARRTTYLPDRYLRPLLRTLTARPQLARMFRTLEIDLHDRLSRDYRNLSLWNKIITLCTGLVRVRGDPCVFFAPMDPYKEGSVAHDMLNYVSRGTLYRGEEALVQGRQKRMWRALVAHTGWEEWVWTPGCMGITVPAFRRFHMGWQALRRLEIRGLCFAKEAGQGSGEVYTEEQAEGSIECLGALEEVVLRGSAMRVLRWVPHGRLTALSVEVAVGEGSGKLQPELEELWAWLAGEAATEGGSKLRSFAISTKSYHAMYMERWLPKTLSFLPDLYNLSVSLNYVHSSCRGLILLSSEDSMTPMPLWQAAFPPEPKLRKLVFFCPGYSHNEFFVSVLRNHEVWPALREVEYCDGAALAEIGWAGAMNTAESRRKGAAVDEQLRMELLRRGLRVVGGMGAGMGRDGDGSGGGDGDKNGKLVELVDEHVEIGRVYVRKFA